MRSVLVVSVGLILISNVIQALSEDPGGKKDTLEALPTPEKLLSHGGRYQESQYGQISEKEPEPVQNEGISSRKPRVNFVSRTRDNNNSNRDSGSREAKNLDVQESRDSKSVYPMPESRSFDLFHKNYPQRPPTYPPMGGYGMYDQGYQGNYVDRYAPPMSQRDYYDNRRTYQQEYAPPPPMMPPVQDPYYNNYPYYPANKMYDMPIEQRQPYVPASIPPVNQYQPPYYQPPVAPGVPGAPQSGQGPSPYPPTEAPPLSPENRNKRIIYYTTLPEVVRTPPNVNLNYHYDRYRARSGVPYDTYYERYNNRYNTYGRWIPQPDY